MEDKACGCPVVSFGSTSLLDIVDHCKNGYLARPFESSDLARGIQWVLEDEGPYKKLCAAARQKAEKKYDLKKVASQYKKLYRDLLGR